MSEIIALQKKVREEEVSEIIALEKKCVKSEEG